MELLGTAVDGTLGRRWREVPGFRCSGMNTPAAHARAVQSATHVAGSAAHTASYTLVERIGHRLHPTAHERLSQLRDRTAVYRAGDPEMTTARQ